MHFLSCFDQQIRQCRMQISRAIISTVGPIRFISCDGYPCQSRLTLSEVPACSNINASNILRRLCVNRKDGSLQSEKLRQSGPRLNPQSEHRIYLPFDQMHCRSSASRSRALSRHLGSIPLPASSVKASFWCRCSGGQRQAFAAGPESQLDAFPAIENKERLIENAAKRTTSIDLTQPVTPLTEPMSTGRMNRDSEGRGTDFRRPWDGKIFSLTPFPRQKSLRYFSAFVWKTLPSGPLVMVSVSGRAEWKKPSKRQRMKQRLSEG